MLKVVPAIQEKVNTTLQIIFYLPLAFFSLAYFTFKQLKNFPYAWYYTIVNKRKIAEWQSESNHKIPRKAVGSTHWTVFIFVGPMKILFRMVMDTFYFFLHLFVKVGDSEDDIAYLNLSQFEVIEEIVEEMNPHKNDKVYFKDIIKALQQRLELF